MPGNGLDTQTLQSTWPKENVVCVPSHHADELKALAKELALEFSAPVGILDPALDSWRTTVGGPESLFPSADHRLREAARLTQLKPGRVSIWHPGGGRDVTWLVLPLLHPEIGVLTSFVGFRSASEAQVDGIQREASQEMQLPLGPVCPEPALEAWGQQISDRMRSREEMRVRQNLPPASNDEESDHAVIGRLIRRMRISDPPARFQALATNVLRTSLGMAAVAWVPSESQESVVVSGEVEGLRTLAYRLFSPSLQRGSTYIVNDPRRNHVDPIPPVVRRYAAVAAGSSGWLVAVNPLEDKPITTVEIERMQYVASLIATQLSNARIYAELKELLFGIIRALTAAIDAKDPYTSGHSERVARIAVRLAEELDMPPQKRSDLYLAGLLHDIGKIGIDDVVLKKSGPLSPEEYRKIQAHVEIGVTILKDLKKLHHILPGVRHHHESLDGSGYPDRLSGEDIPFEARILAVADSFDAMSSNRPYRKRLTPMQIDEILKKGRGIQWDPKVVDALFACRMDVEAIRQKGLGESLIGAVNVTLGRS